MSSEWQFDKQTCGFNQAKAGSYATMMRNQPTKMGMWPTNKWSSQPQNVDVTDVPI
jgi:hypothetical protein